MKKIISSIVISIILISTSLTTLAQSDETEIKTYKSPKWISEKGFWVVETNIHTPGSTIVYFYTNDKILVYKEHLEGIVINLKKRRVKMNLKKILEQSVTAYNYKHLMAENKMLVKNLIGKH